MANLQSKAAAPKAKAATVKTAKTSTASSAATPVATTPVAATPVKAQPQRFRLSVPAADEAVLMWMNLQDNPSLSVRMLIREGIERLGYVDVINRPVSQLPQRGLPAVPEAAVPEPAVPKEKSIQAVRAATTPPPPAPAGQLEVNDLFSKLR